MSLQATAKAKRDDRRAAIHAIILEIARAAFLQDGYAATSMSQIAAKVGGSKATLYNYFPSKKDLFVALADEESTQIFAPLFDVSEMRGDIRTVLERFVRRFLVLLLSDDLIAFYRLIVAESARFPEVGMTAYEFGMKRGLENMAGYFAETIERGELRRTNALVAAEQFLDLCAGQLHRKRLWAVACDISQEEIEAQAMRVVTTFLAAYGNDELSRAARAGIAMS
ncbi:MAG: TetR/AcrR family transcriptional regulator [Rhizomicrobium sp.]|jgi:AcrR family transcriptional regulator